MRRLVSLAIVTMLAAATGRAQQQPVAPPPPVAPEAVQTVPPQPAQTPPAQTPPAQTPQPGQRGVQGQRGQAVPGQGRQGQPGRGQTTPPGPNAPVAPAMQQPRPELASTWQNIKVDIAISDSYTAEVQTKKSISLIVLDGRSGQIRSTGGNSIINIDAAPTVRPDGRIYLHLTLEYQPEFSQQQTEQLKGSGRITMYMESLSLVVADGKPLMASQSADPRSERRVSVEITATVLK
jgi:hypothetical protein